MDQEYEALFKEIKRYGPTMAKYGLDKENLSKVKDLIKLGFSEEEACKIVKASLKLKDEGKSLNGFCIVCNRIWKRNFSILCGACPLKPPWVKISEEEHKILQAVDLYYSKKFNDDYYCDSKLVKFARRFLKLLRRRKNEFPGNN